ncbi:aspartate--tRNA(Asn) ligase [Candidatus Dojkabacteria bacterium CG_4_9_14_3_um_filter_150_Dojkabacteria_WS6_41_13]|uniref:Aspartate--tRNA(Asn) ligase n=1 Tax=Candidatus Dojkabacteria bacterium CG_4_10_14_0_2_um_filter_Dojkabacteria_WS6_41_15 TaxID=2014249 RepID=A0A2M7W396_9BACT|nr:MAG: aspartate--tRNA(Asn) ligase [Candidatus Dojkabacteria bacterium CG_4_10_14_3_um_filter_Dojkabacteria_WS6_41_9]PJA15900.1 MAG: aspartate--tRNA(Asn) ligase [Candidatus Dojkabacteria bacterium CG_4_10_14_0_2_um_filter_Dojkabacteria_WS6_41_15]PJB22836.1 MAG: aspartate--tRNA(Asn) ligase [Candidatus Dojkabacteria bacterium CG_4_9_14_3_um_filter_150_Dojkabacteria_WS6_41_13]
MKRTISSELSSQVSKEVRVDGWLHNFREMGKLGFLILRDRGGLLQVVVNSKEALDELSTLQPGSVVRVLGTVKKTDSTEIGVEIIDPKVEVLVPIKEVPPVSYNKKSIDVNVDTELDFRPLVLRNIKKQAIFKVQALILQKFAESLRSQGFTEFKSPVLMSAPSESGASVFEVNYFEGKAYLAQSPQVYKQIMVTAFERAFCVGPAFRAEKHNTTRHIMEVTQMDAEMGFIDDYDEAMEVAEKVIKDIVEAVTEQYKDVFSLYGVELPKIPAGRFPKVKVREGLELIEKRLKKSAEREDLDLDPEDERELSKWALEEKKSDFLWVINFKNNKNFYTYDDPKFPDESLSFDLEFRGLEMLSGTHRINDYNELYKRFKLQGLTDAYYEHYFQSFKYGMPSEAGFSFGLERLTMKLFDLQNIREATLFPSDLKRIAGANRVKEQIKGDKEVVARIKKILDTRAIPYKFEEHEAVRTSEEAAALRGTSLENGAKALILVGKKSGNQVMVVIPGDKKIAMTVVSEKVGEKVEFEKPETILEKYGIMVGGVPPFGNVLGMRLLMDEAVATRPEVTFNAGMQTCSITMKGADLAEVSDAEIGKFTTSS